MNLSVTRDEFAKLCGECAMIRKDHEEVPAAGVKTCESCVFWHLCDGNGIDKFVTGIIMPKEGAR